MDETRAIARLPHLDVEIWHRRLPEEQAEQLAISPRATPSFADFAKILERQAPWPWLALQPWLVWGQIAQAVWQPWLAAVSAATTAGSQSAPDRATASGPAPLPMRTILGWMKLLERREPEASSISLASLDLRRARSPRH